MLFNRSRKWIVFLFSGWGVGGRVKEGIKGSIRILFFFFLGLIFNMRESKGKEGGRKE